jgi:hypothetical protein
MQLAILRALLIVVTSRKILHASLSSTQQETLLEKPPQLMKQPLLLRYKRGQKNKVQQHPRQAMEALLHSRDLIMVTMQ